MQFMYGVSSILRMRRKITLAFIFSVRIMRAMLHIAAWVHRFLTCLSREFNRACPKTQFDSGFSG